MSVNLKNIKLSTNNLYVSPKVITDGLVLYYDSSNVKSIISGNTLCVDLSKNLNNFSQINGVNYDVNNLGSLIFDGSDDYIDVSPNLNIGSVYTIDMWLKLNDLNSRVWLGGALSSTYYHMNFLNGNLASRATALRTLTFGATTGVWFNAVLVRNDNAVYAYKNSILTDQNLTTTWATNQFIIYRIGASPSGFYGNGNLASVKIYNRVLNQNEIIQNYNAIKNRFGL